MADYSRVTPWGWEQGNDSNDAVYVTPGGWEQITGTTGKLYYVIAPSSAWVTPTASEIKYGIYNGSAAVSSGSQLAPLISTNEFAFSTPATGLAASTSYRIAYVWSDGVYNSEVVVSAPFTTEAASSSLPVLSFPTYVPGSLSITGFRPRVTATWS